MNMNGKRTILRITPHRMGIVLITLSFIWSLYIIKIQLDERSSQSDYFKTRIIQLSEEYIQVRVKSLESINGQISNDISDLKKTTADLLDNMMDRINTLERQVGSATVNSEQRFKNREKKSKSFDKTAASNCVVPVNPSYPDCAAKVTILIHIGVLANEAVLHFAANAGKGGPLGELVQWSDLISSLYLLGHDISVTADTERLHQILEKTGGRRNLCPSKLPSHDFDLIYLDYHGMGQMPTVIGHLNMSHFKCKLRILDVFGTEAQFNYEGFTEKIAGGSMGAWGRYSLNLQQFMTLYPHSPDNSFLGFVVWKPPTMPTKSLKKKKKRALLYGKHYYIWKDVKNKAFLDVVNKYLEIHATFGGGNISEVQKHIPKYVINHGVLPAVELKKLLQDTMVFVGLGIPYEGPAPLEAIARGCFYLNPKYDPPRNRINTAYFRDKPTLRKVTSQNPYTEEFISKPYVYTVNIDNNQEVDDTMKKIMLAEPVKPYLPFEFTHQGMLERLHEFVQNQDFCKATNWPPRNVVRPIKGALSKSCKEICHNNGMVCEPHLFQEINSKVMLTRAGFPCDTAKSEETPSLVAPGFRTDNGICLIQAQPLLYSCTASSPTTKRLCPCREFKPGQVALCKTC